jgi:hypothetical protein
MTDPTYYKATRPDGTDFKSGTIDYAAALASGAVIRHPAARKIRDDASTYLSVSVEPADCTGFSWPCRLFRVEPVGRVMGAGKVPLTASPNKRAVPALRVVEELPAWQALGPNGEAVATFIDRLPTLSPEQIRALAAARRAAGAAGAAYDAACDAAYDAAYAAAGDAAGAAWAAYDAAYAAAGDAAVAAAYAAAYDAACDAAYAAAGDAAWAAYDAAYAAAGDAARAILVRDRIAPQHFAILTQPFRDAGLGEWLA